MQKSQSSMSDVTSNQYWDWWKGACILALYKYSTNTNSITSTTKHENSNRVQRLHSIHGVTLDSRWESCTSHCNCRSYYTVNTDQTFLYHQSPKSTCRFDLCWTGKKCSQLWKLWFQRDNTGHCLTSGPTGWTNTQVCRLKLISLTALFLSQRRWTPNQMHTWNSMFVSQTLQHCTFPTEIVLLLVLEREMSLPESSSISVLVKGCWRCWEKSILICPLTLLLISNSSLLKATHLCWCSCGSLRSFCCFCGMVAYQLHSDAFVGSKVDGFLQATLLKSSTDLTVSSVA